MEQAFSDMRQAARSATEAGLQTRLERLASLRRMIADNRELFGRAIAEDFGQRPQAETDLAEVFPTLEEIRYACRHLRRWMRPQRIRVGRWFLPARAHIRPRPLGIVGIVAPWNYPLFLTAAPLIAALAAGNRAMVKLSEHAPAFAAAFDDAARRHFAPDVLHCVTGGPDIAQAFTALPFDHLLFTGSTATGRKVMSAASANLTPVTLELGGKSPALLAPDARLDHAVARIMTGKLLNAGQTCIAPDYVLLPVDQLQPFIAAAQSWTAAHYPKLAENRDYTRIINAGQFARLSDWLQAAQAQGSTIHPLSDAAPDPTSRLMPPMIVTDPAGPLAEDEIFGPILPVFTYSDMDEALHHINARPRPLAFYLFTDDAETRDLALSSIIAGGVCINDVIVHVAQPGLPFGGVGDSGMGAYHGEAGFRQMSHMQPVFIQSRLAAVGLLSPPYRARFRNLMRLMLR